VLTFTGQVAVLQIIDAGRVLGENPSDYYAFVILMKMGIGKLPVFLVSVYPRCYTRNKYCAIL